jgi:putative peptide zinc metalloprotease protein
MAGVEDTRLPACRADLIVRAVGDAGEVVVKDPVARTYFQLGAAEGFLLTRLTDRPTAEAVCLDYRARFGEPLAGEDLREFVEQAQSMGLLEAPVRGVPSLTLRVGAPTRSVSEGASDRRSPSRPRRNLLYWRKAVWDPDRCFSWLAPRLWFFWTPAFVLIAAGGIALAVVVAVANGPELAGAITGLLRWRTVALAVGTVVVVGLLHECAHGLTCKRFGGEVREVGVLLVCLMPGFYCDVSDAWLFRERAKRLWVTFAGGFFELFLWAAAVLVWRATAPGTPVNDLAVVALSVTGLQTVLNFLPLLKLDGYYLLSDWLRIPNLHERALAAFQQNVRRVLWGAPKPDPGSAWLRVFGLGIWVCTATAVGIGLAGFAGLVGPGRVEFWLVVPVAIVVGGPLFGGFFAGEVRRMVRVRHKRTAAWALGLAGVAGALTFIPVPDRAGGPVEVRSACRAEIRAPAAAFLREVGGDEGEPVSAGARIARLEIPDLASRREQKAAEVCEARARLRLLEAGPRGEEVAEQRRRVGRAESWVRQGREDVRRLRQVLDYELARWDRQIAERQADLNAAVESVQRVRALVGGPVSSEQYAEAVRRRDVCQAQLDQARAGRQGCALKGILDAEAELMRRERDLADARGTLTLLEAGARPEEIDAARARLARLREEAADLARLQERLTVFCPVSGVVTTPRLRGRVGQFVREGDVICTIEEPAALELELAVAEEDAARVRPGQAVALRVRASPSETHEGRVERIAPTADRGTVTVYCRLDQPPDGLRPGLTGYGRVDTGSRSLGGLLIGRCVRFVRIECWWW